MKHLITGLCAGMCVAILNVAVFEPNLSTVLRIAIGWTGVTVAVVMRALVKID